ncbi:MAG: hypothetical protein L0H59_05605 [Tomitella sp.]|nr:hypothetical protein [Tomitella sp.]
MRLNRMCAGVATAAAVAFVASPAVADAADKDEPPNYNTHVNGDELTADTNGDVTTVDFKPGRTGDDVSCFGPIVFSGKAPQEGAVDLGGVAANSGGDDPDYDVVLPDGLVDANGVPYTTAVNPDGAGETDLLLAYRLSAVGEHDAGDLGALTMPDSVERADTSNAFSYKLNSDSKYMAIGECGRDVSSGGGAAELEDPHFYIRTINHDKEIADPDSGPVDDGPGESGSLGSIGSLGILGSLGSLDESGSVGSVGSFGSKN